MIEHFLDPHPDEILYSVWARMSDCLRYRYKEEVPLEFFGTKIAMPKVDLPCHLGYFYKNLPSGHSYTLDILINQYTLYPLYAPFLPEDQICRLREQMISDNAQPVHRFIGRLGNKTYLTSSPLWLRYCPTCVEEDRAKYGECYWHRLHQVLGVEACLKHDTFLENSAVRTRADFMPSARQFVAAERAIGVITPRKVTSGPVNDVLSEITRSVASLLERLYLPSDDHFILRQYHSLLAQRGYMTLNGSHRILRLLNAFVDYYPPELLSLLHCELKLTGHIAMSWLASLTHRSGSMRHPLQHILLIHFLGSTVESFLGREIPYPRSYQNGLWPCLNPVCEHYRQRHIRECQVSEIKGLLVRRITCSCGFEYIRSGPDRSDEDIFRRDKILTYGPLWEAKLRELWFDPTIKLQEIGNQLGVVPMTVNRQAARLQLPVPRTAYRTPRSRVKHMRKKVKDPSWYRTQWITLVNTTPGENISALRKKLSGVYWWLLKFDKEWLMANRPSSGQKPKNPLSLSLRSMQEKIVHEDPKTWDIQMADAVRACAQTIINETGYPKRVTKRKILIAVPEIKHFDQHKAPLTVSALQEVIESPRTFTLRRIQWFIQKCHQEQRYPTRSEFIHSIHLAHILHIPEVLNALNEAMDALTLPKCQ